MPFSDAPDLEGWPAICKWIDNEDSRKDLGSRVGCSKQAFASVNVMARLSNEDVERRRRSIPSRQLRWHQLGSPAVLVLPRKAWEKFFVNLERQWKSWGEGSLGPRRRTLEAFASTMMLALAHGRAKARLDFDIPIRHVAVDKVGWRVWTQYASI